MKKYTKPGVVVVPLSPEQAVLGTCMAGITAIKDSSTIGCKLDCKQKRDTRGADYAGSS
jgi:hypothetical protein